VSVLTPKAGDAAHRLVTVVTELGGELGSDESPMTTIFMMKPFLSGS
jgi:hypothetical protein